MGAAYFYHLTQRSQDETLRMLLDRARAAGWAVAVRGTSRDRLAWLDDRLWLGAEDAFLPHGLAGGRHDALQPVLLCAEGDALANDPVCLMTVDGAALTAQEVEAMERVCVLFDGTDESAVQVARGQWTALKKSGCSAQYWSEESGRWEKKAET